MNSILCRTQSVKIGDSFGYLVVAGPVFHVSSITKSGRFSRESVCVVKCTACNGFAVWSLNHLKRRDNWSCGCLRKARLSKANTFRPHFWKEIKSLRRHMIDRCYNPKHRAYPWYGARGVTVCDKWINDLNAFYWWCIDAGFSPKLEIDRKDTNGQYEPSNCRFVTHQENMRNTRTNVVIYAWGESKTLPEWAEDKRCRVSAQTIRLRLGRSGWTNEDAISTPSLKPVQYSKHGGDRRCLI